MKRLAWVFPAVMFAACHKEEAASLARVSVPGYWFQLIFIVLPLIVILAKIFIDLAAVRESLFSMESQFRRVNSRLEELEEKLSPPPSPSKPKSKADNKKE
jgi:hypothetical protein